VVQGSWALFGFEVGYLGRGWGAATQLGLELVGGELQFVPGTGILCREEKWMLTSYALMTWLRPGTWSRQGQFPYHGSDGLRAGGRLSGVYMALKRAKLLNSRKENPDQGGLYAVFKGLAYL